LIYLLPRLDALSGFTFLVVVVVVATWVAKLQFPAFHFRAGSGQAEQNQPAEYSVPRLQPLHFSTISWQIPPL